ncbi:MAG: hypothetical protein CEO22_123 [Candidatus Berkelbacteria bacterium Gr01-1014_85]|uniref:Uncharacterized protein n=1 Tax=Candidatus Berkelbacteria bacterium Gr01-1014_85 TaxID=2017150 RepID=A0A554JDL8_9BACT|nr:MAG: hypothetical protein CEO22_123 [Candidatus Berkelbacteria bacterium Gr01-1014_85]
MSSEKFIAFHGEQQTREHSERDIERSLDRHWELTYQLDQLRIELTRLEKEGVLDRLSEHQEHHASRRIMTYEHNARTAERQTKYQELQQLRGQIDRGMAEDGESTISDTAQSAIDAATQELIALNRVVNDLDAALQNISEPTPSPELERYRLVNAQVLELNNDLQALENDSEVKQALEQERASETAKYEHLANAFLSLERSLTMANGSDELIQTAESAITRGYLTTYIQEICQHQLQDQAFQSRKDRRYALEHILEQIDKSRAEFIANQNSSMTQTRQETDLRVLTDSPQATLDLLPQLEGYCLAQTAEHGFRFEQLFQLLLPYEQALRKQVELTRAVAQYLSEFPNVSTTPESQNAIRDRFASDETRSRLVEHRTVLEIIRRHVGSLNDLLALSVGYEGLTRPDRSPQSLRSGIEYQLSARQSNYGFDTYGTLMPSQHEVTQGYIEQTRFNFQQRKQEAAAQALALVETEIGQLSPTLQRLKEDLASHQTTLDNITMAEKRIRDLGGIEGRRRLGENISSAEKMVRDLESTIYDLGVQLKRVVASPTAFFRGNEKSAISKRLADMNSQLDGLKARLATDRQNLDQLDSDTRIIQNRQLQTVSFDAVARLEGYIKKYEQRLGYLEAVADRKKTDIISLKA